MSDFKYHHVIVFAGGVAVMSLGASIISYSNSIMCTPSTTSSPPPNIMAIRNLGVAVLLIGLATMIWYAQKLYRDFTRYK